jgi:hypothetical protein
MGKFFVLGLAIVVGYVLGFRDARNHSDHVVSRAVDQVRETFGAANHNDIDGKMNTLEGKN